MKFIPLNDVVLVHSDKTPRSICDAVISDLIISGYQYVIWYSHYLAFAW